MEVLFGLLNVAVLPWWLSMLLFPGTRTTRALVVSPWPFVVLAGMHALLLFAALVSGEAPSSLSAAALARMLAGTWGFLAVWTHLVALNLFAGVWIFRDARYFAKLPRAELVLTWFLGPLGVGIYLWRRRNWTARDPVRVVS